MKVMNATLLVMGSLLSPVVPLAMAQGSQGKEGVSKQDDAKAGTPPVFTKSSFKDALAHTSGTKKVLIVKGTAAWCGPCKQMDRTTWRDEQVVAWVKEHGLALQVDVDEEPEVAKELRIRAMPTMIAFKDGKEVDRVVGFQSAAKLLAWAEGVEAGETSDARTSKNVLRAEAGELDADARYELARSLVQAGKHEEATKQFVWLWENIPEQAPHLAGVRASFMTGDMEELVEEHDPAREAFTTLRDEAQRRLEGEHKGFRDLEDWIVLNGVIGDDEATIDWFDRIKDRPTASKTFGRVWFRIEELLLERERFADLGRAMTNPLASLRSDHSILAMTLQFAKNTPPGEDGPPPGLDMEEFSRANFREKTGRRYAWLLAAGRDEVAADFARLAIELDDTGTMRVAMVRESAAIGQRRAGHEAWLDEAKKMGEPVADVREMLDALVK